MATPSVLLRRAPQSASAYSSICQSCRIKLQRANGQLRYAHIKGSPEPTSPPPSRPARSSRPSAVADGSEPIVLEKPDRYRKPSHPARIPRRSARTGPTLSEEEVEAQKTKQYPNMMPPEGSVLHWFLTNRRIHLVITFGVLGSLCTFVWVENFRSSLSSEHYELLPSRSLLPLHPFQFCRRFIEVYKLHVQRTSMEVENMRLRNVADAQKRELYRKAHGIEIQSIPNLLGFKEEKAPEAEQQVAGAAVVGPETPAANAQDAEVYNDFEGRKQKTRKWAPFGISLW